jgi:type II secretory pathway pseudopilin PulG
MSGFTLLEVVLAIAVFAFGLLALIELQTGLARSSADANTRTVAVNLAEEYLEDARGFTQISAVDGNKRLEYDEILTEGPDDVQVGEDSAFGVIYKRNIIVDEYYWDAATESFSAEAPVGIVNSDYKTIDIVVMWRDIDGAEGETWEDHDSIDFGNFGGGIRIVESVPSAPSVLGALVAASREVVGGPQVVYNPGEQPEIIRITLDGAGGKFKESTTPMPDVIRNETVETWFDVVTYSQAAADVDAIFLRREEFVAITCECELETNPAVANYGRKPTLWNGVDYTEGEKAAKPIGIPVGPEAQQSMFCGVCCGDHHDGAGGGAEDVYRMENVGGDADHPHHTRGADGEVIETPVADGEEYLEACRLIRKDGFMRVTQDANQNALIGFPEGYLDFDEGVAGYSAYVTESAGEYYTTGQVSFPQPNPPDVESTHEFPARTALDATTLPTLWVTNSQQMRARAVYTDYLTAAAQSVIDECFPLEARTEDCPAPNTTTEFEIYPFFDLQMTWLARWNNISMNDLVSVTNEPIETANTHSRGFLELTSDGAGQSEIAIDSHKDNLGLTATGPIDLLYEARRTDDLLFVDANNADIPVPPIGAVVSGELRSALRRVPPADLLLEAAGGALCGQTDTTWACSVSGDAALKVGNYYLNVPRTWACSELTFNTESIGPPAEDHYTVFDLPPGGSFDIWITDDFEACGR